LRIARTTMRGPRPGKVSRTSEKPDGVGGHTVVIVAKQSFFHLHRSVSRRAA